MSAQMKTPTKNSAPMLVMIDTSAKSISNPRMGQGISCLKNLGFA